MAKPKLKQQQRTGQLRRPDVRRLRMALCLTQEELASVVGTHVITVSRWERGLAVPGSYAARVLGSLALAATRGVPLPEASTRADPLRLLNHYLSYAYGQADLELSLLSATNRLPGRVLELRRGDIMSKVVIEVGVGVHIAAVITTDSVDRLRLKPGSAARAIIKATEVMVATTGAAP